MKDIYIITGGPGFGKTTIIEEIKKEGFNGGEELSRQFIQEQMSRGGKLLPWIDRLRYSKIMLKKRIKQYEKTPLDELWFFDRGIPDLIAYLLKDEHKVPTNYYKASKKYRYNKIVFLTPPWKEIHKNDSERKETFKEAKKIHNVIKKTYHSLGYKCINIPKRSIKKRFKFVLSKIKK